MDCFFHSERSAILRVAGGDSVTTERCFTNGRHASFEPDHSRSTPKHEPISPPEWDLVHHSAALAEL
jgi:hypothetical protein